jgi:ubiquinone/menaquinone biosynthesis C-methylase UbiE
MADRKSLAAAYDRSAPTYDERFRALQRPKYEAALPWLSDASGLCLDAGGGTGLLAEVLPRPRWLILDLSPGMLRLAPSPLKVQGDLARLPFRANAFAAVAAFTSLLDERERALGELSRVLRPEGKLVVSVLAKEKLASFTRLRHIAGPIPRGRI